MPLLRARTFSCQRLTLSMENEGRLPGFGSGLFGSGGWGHTPWEAPRAGAEGKQAGDFRNFN